MYMLNTTNNTWEQIVTPTSPTSRSYVGYVVLDNVGILAFGGLNSVGNTANKELWLFDGTNWTLLAHPITTGDWTGCAVGLDYVNDSLQLVIGKCPYMGSLVRFLKLNMSGGLASILQTTPYSVPNPTEIILTLETLSASKPFCEVSTDGGLTFYPINIEEIYSTSGKNNGGQTIFRFTLESQTEIKGWGFNFDK